MTGGASATPPPATAPPVRVSVPDAFPEDIAAWAGHAVGAVLRASPEYRARADAVRGVRVRLSAHRDPAVHFPVVAQVNLDFAGVAVRAQAHAATASEAIDLLLARLRHQLERAARPPGGDGLGHWRHPRPVGKRAASFPRPPHTCLISRYKPCLPARLGLDEAIHRMECMDYGFHLFTEVGTGVDSVVYRAGASGYRLAQTRPDPEHLAPHTVAVTCYDRPAPRLDLATAVELFGMTEVRFLFFVSTEPDDTGPGGIADAIGDGDSGTVLYRRFDGHYGLLFRGVPGQRRPPAQERIPEHAR